MLRVVKAQEKGRGRRGRKIRRTIGCCTQCRRSRRREGYKQCSYGQLQFKPLTNHRLLRTDGVYTLNHPNTAVIGIDDTVVAAAALDKATLDFGAQLNTLVDHVMFCLPPGTADFWVAYAYFNNWRSVYNNERCQRPSKATISICTTQMKQMWNMMLISRDLWYVTSIVLEGLFGRFFSNSFMLFRGVHLG